jgi:hypothetical protein
VENNWTPQVHGDAAKIGDSGTLANLLGIWGASESEIYAVGSEGTVIFYDGQNWNKQATPTSAFLTAVWGTAANDVWAVGFDGTVIHYDGTGWFDHSPPLAVFHTADGGPPTGDAGDLLRRNLWGVWATGTPGTTNVLYAVGNDGAVIHFDGNLKIWSDKIPVTADGAPMRVQDDLNAVWGTGPNRVYIVGDFGTILEGGKNGLAVQNTGVTKDLHGVWGTSNNNVYAVGTGGTILHRGGSWRRIEGAPKQVLRGIWGPSNNLRVTYIVGWDGTLLRMTGGPGFSQGANFDPFYCIVPGHRLEGIWGTILPMDPVDAGPPPPPPPDLGATDADLGPADYRPPPPDLPLDDAGIPWLPAVWVAGASGMVVSGP